MAAAMLYFGRRYGHRIPRVFRDRTNYLDHMDDTQLIEVYRLDREGILEMLISLLIFPQMLDLLLYISGNCIGKFPKQVGFV